MEIGHPRLPVFVSYAHEDNEGKEAKERWLDRLLQMLKPLKLNDQVCAWSDKDIQPGRNWKEAIEFQLREYAKAAVLLVSPAFLASDFIRNGELPVLLKRSEDEGLTVIPVILRSCLFEEAKFRYPDHEVGPQTVSLSVFQAINSPKRPLVSMTEGEQDEVLKAIGLQLKNIFERTRQ